MNAQPISRSSFYKIGNDFGLQGLEPLAGEPPDWRGTKDAQVNEEVLETFLSLRLSDITQEQMTLFARSGEHWDVADLMGIDDFGRVHIFELKKGPVNRQVVKQLNHYLLRNVFEDSYALVRKWWHGDEYRPRVLCKRLPLYLAGALAGLRTSNLGGEFVTKWGAAFSVKGSRFDLKKKWLDYTTEERDELLTRALLQYAEKYLQIPQEEIPNLDSLQRNSERWYQDLSSTAEPPVPILPAARKAVIWLVGRSIEPDAHDEIKEWRSREIDARWLTIHVEHSPQRAQWYLRVKREDAPQRGKLFGEVRAWANVNKEMAKECVVKFVLYEEQRPSAKRSSPITEKGDLKAECRAEICQSGKVIHTICTKACDKMAESPG